MPYILNISTFNSSFLNLREYASQHFVGILHEASLDQGFESLHEFDAQIFRIPIDSTSCHVSCFLNAKRSVVASKFERNSNSVFYALFSVSRIKDRVLRLYGLVGPLAIQDEAWKIISRP